MPERSHLLRWLILLGALGLAAYALFSKLQQDLFLRGADAYYYALQIDHWARTGHVRIPDSAWIFSLLGFLQRFGPTTESLIRGFTGLSLFGASLSLWWSEREAPMFRRTISALWVALSPVLLFTAIEFPKMFVVMALFPLWDLTADRRRMLVSLIAMGLALWMHRSASVLLATFAIGFWLDRRTFPGKFLSVLAIFLLGIWIFLGDRSPLVDLSRFLPVIRLSEPGLLSLASRTSLPLALKVELVVATVCFSFLLLQKIFRNDSRIPFRYAMPALLGFLPWGSQDVFSIGERFALFLPMLTLLIWCRSGERTSDEKIPIAVVVIMGVAALFAGARLNLSHPLVLDPENGTYDKVTRLIASRSLPMLIAHKTFAYYYKYRTHLEAFPYEPEEHWDKMRVWRLTDHIRPDELWSYLSPECRDRMEMAGPEYLLLREDCWEEGRAKITAEEDSDLDTRARNSVWNPSQKRPSFLYPKHERDDRGDFPALPPGKRDQ